MSLLFFATTKVQQVFKSARGIGKFVAIASLKSRQRQHPKQHPRLKQAETVIKKAIYSLFPQGNLCMALGEGGAQEKQPKKANPYLHCCTEKYRTRQNRYNLNAYKL